MWLRAATYVLNNMKASYLANHGNIHKTLAFVLANSTPSFLNYEVLLDYLHVGLDQVRSVLREFEKEQPPDDGFLQSSPKRILNTDRIHMICNHFSAMISRATQAHEEGQERNLIDSAASSLTANFSSFFFCSAGDCGSSTEHSVVLNDGVVMPLAGFGTWQLQNEQCYDAVLQALRSGVRHIDTAQGYFNEAEVGSAISDFLKESGLHRRDVFIVSKLTIEYGYRETLEQFQSQLLALQTDYIDVYMLHHFKHHNPRGTVEAYRALVDLRSQGKIKALGVSNFERQHLESFCLDFGACPNYVQQKFSIYQPGERSMTVATGSSSESYLTFIMARNITMVGYSMLNSVAGVDLQPAEDPHVIVLSHLLKKSPAQVLHRWAVQQRVGVIPRSTNEDRVKQNMQLFDFSLSDSAMMRLNSVVGLMHSPANEIFPRWSSDSWCLQERTILPAGDPNKSSPAQFDDMPKLPNRVTEILYEHDLPPRTRRLMDYLRHREDVVEFIHSKDTMVDHLINTGKMLHIWGMPEDVVLFGLVHSIYGATGVFKYSLLNGASDDDRKFLRGMIGDDAERLAYLYSQLAVSDIANPANTGRWLISGGAFAEKASGDGTIFVNASDAFSIVIGHLADCHEQSLGVSSWLYTSWAPNPQDQIWPGDDRHHADMNRLFHLCIMMRRVVSSVPAIFRNCTHFTDFETTNTVWEIYSYSFFNVSLNCFNFKSIVDCGRMYFLLRESS